MKDETAKKFNEVNRRTYDTIAEQFSSTRSLPWSEFRDIVPYVNDGDALLDAGCGNGRLLDVLRDKKINYTGIDFSKALIAIAKKQHPDRTFVISDITTLPFPEEKFNIIFCIATLHHLAGQTLRRKALAEMRRVCKKDGYLVLLNWNLWTPRWWPAHIRILLKKIVKQIPIDFGSIWKLWKDGQGRIVDKRYIHGFWPGELRTLLAQNGFTVEKQYYTIKGQPAHWYSGFNLITIARKS